MLVHDGAPVERRVLVDDDLDFGAIDLGEALVAVRCRARDAEVELPAVDELNEARCVVNVLVLGELLQIDGRQPRAD